MPDPEPIEFDEVEAAGTPADFDDTATAAPLAEDERTLWERAKEALGGAADTAADTYAGAQRGFRMGEAKPGQIEQKMGVAVPEEEMRARWNLASERSPVMSTVGDAVGSAINPLSRSSGIAGNAAAGAAMGGLRARGEGNDVATGAAAGGVFGAAATALPQAVGALGKSYMPQFKRFADLRRLRQFGGRMEDLKKLPAQKAGKLAADAEAAGLHRGALGLPATVERVGQNADTLAAAGGAEKDAVAARIAEAPVEPTDIATKVRLMQQEHGFGPAGLPMRNALNNEADEFAAMPRQGQPLPGFEGPTSATPGGVRFADMNLERQSYGKKTNFLPGAPKERLADAQPQIYGAINETMQDAANQFEPGAGDAWRGANAKEALGIQVGNMANKESTRNAVNRQMSPSDMGMGIGVGVGSGNPALGAAAGVVNKFWRGREHGTIANVARGLQHSASDAQALGKFGEAVAPGATAAFAGQAGRHAPTDPVALAKRDPAAFGRWAPEFEAAGDDSTKIAATWQRLQSDPEFVMHMAARVP